MNNIFLHKPVCDLLHQYVPVSSGLSDDQILPSLSSAFDLFVVPLLGQQLADKLIQLQTTADTATQTSAVEICRTAVANLAFWYNFTELNVRITDQGFQRQEGDTFKSLYKYQEDELKQRFRVKGFQALDMLLSVLDMSRDDFPEYTKSPAYIEQQKCLVRSAQEVSQIYYTDCSSLIFLRLLPIIRNHTATLLPGIIGNKLYEKIELSLNGNVPKGFLFEPLREKILPWLVMISIGSLIRSSGSLTDRGLYFQSVMATSGNTMVTEPVPSEQQMMQLEQIDNTAKAYQQRLINYIKLHYPDDFTGNPSGIYHRDNDHKKTFFA